MSDPLIYVLIHSPLVGASTWQSVADEMRRPGLVVFTPLLSDSPDSNEPYWKQHADSAARSLADISKDVPLILVAHSGAGPILAVIRQSMPNPVHAYVFVDAGIPRNGATRLDLMKSEDADWTNEFQAYLEGGGRFPNWSSDSLLQIIPDQNIRENLVAELHPRGLDFFTEPVPVFDGWPDAPCIYIQLSAAYKWDAAQAEVQGWPTYKIEAGHFHMLVDPKQVTELITGAVENIIRS